ncbi:LLM class flavin-dependent oxidoreductase [Micromonospora sp. KC207]|uniref:MupA/Atu3671 family FMN-dependent luciferase-like monooxygenase n=1 Tax=Micromonospora sp. KC207 TaxID=2530377 RepID=UPI00104C8392|nr:MupA/Atu3671 family FMN-dependent luciferase-like monooxygenase [Micromonospora sp. KC207]TDC67113.1 LLM class flavin-dependent oxidoreductase [Micromonospora sp. KC207]
MEFSLFYFADDGVGGPATASHRYRLLLEGARFADTHGFAAVWTPERHFHPFGGLYPNPAVTAAALATSTERIRIRAGSVVAPLHDPIRIAEEWLVVDNLSGGRAEVSFASGWHPTDFLLQPGNYDQRREVLISTVESVRQLWRGDEVERRDGRGEMVRVRAYPPAVQPELPVWLTSAGNTGTFKAAGAMGAGVLTHLLQQDLPTLAGNIAEYRSALGGRPGRVALMLHTFVGEDTGSVRTVVRDPLRAYLASSTGLFAGASAAAGPDLDPSLLEELLDMAFERYFTVGGLFGSVGHASAMVDRVRGIGVDEIACLIDFGIPAGQVLDSLRFLDELRAASAA